MSVLAVSVCESGLHVYLHRFERLEEQLNDLSELHQNELTNLKQELASMEEKVAYQSYERARDIQVHHQQVPAKPVRFYRSVKKKFTVNYIDIRHTLLSKSKLYVMLEESCPMTFTDVVCPRTLIVNSVVSYPLHQPTIY